MRVKSIFEQFMMLTNEDKIFEKEIEMFTPEIQHLCSWLERVKDVHCFDDLSKYHPYAYRDFLLDDAEGLEGKRRRDYVNARTFGMQLFFSVLYYASITETNYADRKSQPNPYYKKNKRKRHGQGKTAQVF